MRPNDRAGGRLVSFTWPNAGTITAQRRLALWRPVRVAPLATDPRAGPGPRVSYRRSVWSLRVNATTLTTKRKAACIPPATRGDIRTPRLELAPRSSESRYSLPEKQAVRPKQNRS
jgi:hypothetical protein